VAERTPVTLRAYRLAAGGLTPFASLLLARRLKRGKEDVARLGERYGRTTVRRPAGALVWLHAASVGELLAVLPLIERIREQGFAILTTTGTLTSAKLAAERLPKGAIHQFVPLDAPRFVTRFLNHWRPDLALFVESDLWPNLITGISDRGIPLMLVNGRLSERSFNTWRRVPSTISTLLNRFDLCLAQSPSHAERYRDLGAPRVTTTGNLKLDGPQPPADEEKLRPLRFSIGHRPVIAATSTHPGEEEIIVQAHLALRKMFPGLLTIIAPRHPERGDEVAAVASTSKLNVVLRSRGGLPTPRTDIYIADTLGELGLIYSLVPMVFIGGSLVSHGGQNPVEAVKLGSAVLHGPHISNFAEIYAELDTANGALPVDSADDLIAAMRNWLEHPSEARKYAAAASHTIEQLGGALERTFGSLQPYLLQLRLERQSRNA